MVQKKESKKLLIVDAHALLHRAYHALPPLTNYQGKPVGAVYGFASILVSNIAQIKPDYLIACFDLPKKTLRHEKFADYKATRPKTPADLVQQFKTVREFLGALEIPILEKEGYEADDAIGTVVQLMKQYPNILNIILTGDLDTLQLVSRQTKVLMPKKGISDPVLYGQKNLSQKYPGLKAKQVIDYKGLRGDASDNIPGVPGIGHKTALKLISHFGSIEGLYRQIEDPKVVRRLMKNKVLGKSLLSKIKENKNVAFFSKELATIYLDAPIKFCLKKAAWNPNPAKIEQVLLGFGFRSLVKRYQAVSQGKELPEPSQASKQKTDKASSKNGREINLSKKKIVRQNSLF